MRRVRAASLVPEPLPSSLANVIEHMPGDRAALPTTLYRALRCHPATPPDAVTELDVEIGQPAPGMLALRYRLAGDVERLRLPPQRPPRRADMLWQHTCFEAFVAVEGAAGYTEFNFAPSTEWAAYAFTGYRSGMRPADLASAPRLAVERNSGRLTLAAGIDLAALPGGRGALRLALSAVVEEIDGRLSYWALKHPAGMPDFHHADAFALHLVPGAPT